MKAKMLSIFSELFYKVQKLNKEPINIKIIVPKSLYDELRCDYIDEFKAYEVVNSKFLIMQNNKNARCEILCKEIVDHDIDNKLKECVKILTNEWFCKKENLYYMWSLW